MNKFIYTLFIISLLQSCAAVKLKKDIDNVLNKPFYENQITGILVYNPDKNDTIINHNSKKYFTPASTTKIATLYTAMQTIPEQIPALKYAIVNDTLFIQGTGDPTLLHPYFKDSTALNFIKGFKNIAVNLTNFHDDKYGPGWAWEDYDYYYQPERNSLPMYGNIATIYKTSKLNSIPKLFEKDILNINYTKLREEFENTFYYSPAKNDTIQTPFIIDNSLIQNLLSKATNSKISIANNFPDSNVKTVYGVVSDSVYKRMMYKSDNFLAEQLLLVSSATLSDTLSFSKAKENILTTHLADLKQKPRWVDGSGLSRYNLFTPASFVQILTKIYYEQPKERIYSIFPAGGVSGTLKNWYKSEKEPYIYAKSGSLGNNYSLCGYLITNSGKTLIFSFMNNHYLQSTSEVKQHMQAIFENLRDNY
ncbi:D-alanyl-D-alanine carboxypeptidase [Cellulophaga baltica]|uniref:D-alanyl-D-alanine carboxypeptidase/D-alanyl-D-alanine-endopeptidase n=1 Tax=Cellulophaga TaxID=104264 RepID=UPI001C06715A|nr:MULTISPECIES: D-alanyl-D-alanine carboxypeptidase [Cellulophaga]MBU2997898.1 D-alanyl-D-alanine carboxypeptidase [Cellulophaga baltica]MDO6769299.1 D-alanyl-D-alanine carboxypeptidase [Cellulophaga sp. 1_MG-2023]